MNTRFLLTFAFPSARFCVKLLENGDEIRISGLAALDVVTMGRDFDGKEIAVRSVLAIVALFLSSEHVAGGLIQRTTFDAGLDGWTFVDRFASPGPDTQMSWSAAGGNLGGFARFDDNVPTGAEGWLSAPASYLGDWSDMAGGGAVVFDHSIIATGGGSRTFMAYRIDLSGPGGSAVFTGATPNTTTGWVTITAPLEAASWNVGSGTWLGLLANVHEFQIRIEMVSNSGSAVADVDGIDNVALVPEPSATMLTAAGGFGLWALRRGRARWFRHRCRGC